MCTNKIHTKNKLTSSAGSNRKRNSSIELLRILAMFMILAHHFVVHNIYSAENLPLGPTKVILQFFFQGFGKVGVTIFFAISTWFLLDKEQSIRLCLRRIWLLEREVLFWSICLALCYFAFEYNGFGIKQLAVSFIPLTRNCWWYATAYAIFLALFPFLSRGLYRLGRNCHFALCLTVVTIWGLLGLIPGGPSLSTDVFGFIYFFILLSFYKWYINPLNIRQIITLIGVGVGFFALYFIAEQCILLNGITIDTNLSFLIISDWKLPVIMIGLGLFLLFERISFYNKVINKIAASTFAVYLITDYPISRQLLWAQCFNLGTLHQQPMTLLRILGILLAIYTLCIILDFIRQAVFSFTINRRKGHWFDLLWNKITTINITQIGACLHIGFTDSSNMKYTTAETKPSCTNTNRNR